jgi:triacylglycerol lipase
VDIWVEGISAPIVQDGAARAAGSSPRPRVACYQGIMSLRDRLRPLATAGREMAAFARQAVLLPRDATAPVLPGALKDGEDVVVFLHGLFATAGVLRPLRAAIGRHPGVHTAALSYPPGPGIEELSGRLAAVVGILPRGVRVHLVGHSLGGVVMRYFAQEAQDPRIVQTISLASPFAGVPRARVFRFELARDLEPASPIMRRLLLGAATARIPHLSIIAAGDALVRSPISHAFPGGDVVVMEGLGHNTLLFDEEVARIVERRVLDGRRRAA